MKKVLGPPVPLMWLMCLTLVLAAILSVVAKPKPMTLVQSVTPLSQEIVQSLQTPAMVKVWRDRNNKPEWFVVATDPQKIEDTGLSKVVVERLSDHVLSTTMIIGSKKIARGQTVQLLEIIYDRGDQPAVQSFSIIK